METNTVILPLGEYERLYDLSQYVQNTDTVVRMINNYGKVHFYFVTKDAAIKELELELKCKEEENNILKEKNDELVRTQKSPVPYILEKKEEFSVAKKLNFLIIASIGIFMVLVLFLLRYLYDIGA